MDLELWQKPLQLVRDQLQQEFLNATPVYAILIEYKSPIDENSLLSDIHYSYLDYVGFLRCCWQPSLPLNGDFKPCLIANGDPILFEGQPRREMGPNVFRSFHLRAQPANYELKYAAEFEQIISQSANPSISNSHWTNGRFEDLAKRAGDAISHAPDDVNKFIFRTWPFDGATPAQWHKTTSAYLWCNAVFELYWQQKYPGFGDGRMPHYRAATGDGARAYVPVNDADEFVSEGFVILERDVTFSILDNFALACIAALDVLLSFNNEMSVEQSQPDPLEPAGSDVAHSTDFRSVRWFGTVYSFTANQALVVRLLHENWKAGTPDVGDDTLLLAVDPVAPPARLSTLFRDHPAWGTMIVAGGTKGTHRLSTPAT